MNAVELIRALAVIVLFWYVPGVAWATLLRTRVRMSAPVYFAFCWIAAPAMFSVLAVPLGMMGLQPVWIAVLVALGTGVAVWRRASPASWWTEVRRRPVLFSIPVLAALLILLVPASLEVTADALAHVSAVRSTVEESSVFPVRGFHGDADSQGVDARFGTLHAWYGALSVLGGSQPLETWQIMRGPALAAVLAGALSLICVMAGSALGVALGVVVLLATFGGGSYNLAEVANYPLWMSLGLIWAMLALGFESEGGPRRSVTLVSGALLAALVGFHFFAFMLGGFLLAATWFSAPRGERNPRFADVAFAALVAIPFVVLRLSSGYASVNPIHQKIWQCMEWYPGLYSGNPFFVAQWLTPVGLFVLVWALVRRRRLRDDLRFRWLMGSALGALAWIFVPVLLTPTMKVIGFLPLRLVMAVGIPFLAALLVDSESRARWIFVGLVALLLVTPGRSRVAGLAAANNQVGDVESWREMLVATEMDGTRAVLASDPYSMLVSHALAPIDVVAVPDGRSSPRDARAIERLRASWTIMSAATNEYSTMAALQDRGVTHVLVNTDLPRGLASYEYPIDALSMGRQGLKFEGNPDRFEPVWQNEKRTLYHVVDSSAAPWNDEYLVECGSLGSPSSDGVMIGDAYRVSQASARIVQENGRDALIVDGILDWTGSGGAPDRQLVVRMDRDPSDVPAALAFIEKPIRKFNELLTGTQHRLRWTAYPDGGRCPTWVTGGGAAIDLRLRFPLPRNLEPGTYSVSLAARDRSIFVPVQLADPFIDDDSLQGPTIAVVQVPDRSIR